MTRSRTIDFASGLDLPVEAVTQTFAVLGRRGSGKSYASSKLAEGMLEADAQIVVLDPIGNWYALRVAADGKGKGFPIPVFGGLHGDVPLEATAGHLLADLVVDRGLSVVLDVSSFRKGDRKRFATDFAEQLFHRKKAARSPLHLFIEEAQAFVPQRVQADDARMLGAFEDIIRQGRNFGLGATLVSQRPQSVNKEVLSQTECLVVLQVNEAQARKALREWIVDVGLDVGDLVETLPGLKRGEAWVWSPQWLGVTKRVHIKRKTTLDASSTPVVGAKRIEPRELAPVDLKKLGQEIAETVERAKENDPKLLKIELRKLRERLNAAILPTVKAWKTKRVEVKVPALSKRQAKALAKTQQAVNEVNARFAALTSQMQLLAKTTLALARCRPEPTGSISIPPDGTAVLGRDGRYSPAPPEGFSPPPNVSPPRKSRRLPGEPYKLQPNGQSATNIDDFKRGAREMLAACVRMSPRRLSRAQLGTWVGLPATGSTFGTYLSALKRADALEERPDGFEVTDVGRTLASVMRIQPPPATTEAMVALWSAKLKAGAREMLRTLVEAHPGTVSREKLGETVGLPATGSTFGTYLSTLRRNGLATVSGDSVAAAEELFLDAA